MTGAALKLIAMVSMLIDHTGLVLFNDCDVMRAIGRLAMPIFAFFISEGYIHTRSKGKYLLRLFIFGIISEVPFDLAFDSELGFGSQNVIFTFTLSVLALILFDLVKGESTKDVNQAIRTVLGVTVVVLISIAALLLNVDYGFLGVIMVFLFYVLKDQKKWIRLLSGISFLLLFAHKGISMCAALSFIPLYLYNGERGKNIKWLFYAFYPAHLLVIYFIKILI